MPQEEDLSVLEYARLHGLAHDHRGGHPLANLALIEDSSVEEFENMPDDFSLEEFNNRLFTERLSIGRDAISLLSFTQLPLSEKMHPFNEDLGLDVHRVRNLKHELPLTRTDHELDMISFRTQIVPDLKSEFFPMETVDEEADEGFTWPSKYHALPGEFAKSSGSETLAVSREALEVLRDALKLSGENEDYGWSGDEVLSYKRNRARDPVTPPLLPLSPPFVPFVPLSETGHLELLSDHSSPTHQQADEVSRLLNDKDAIVPTKRKREVASDGSDPSNYDITSVEEFYSPLKGLREPPSSPPPPARREPLKNWKVEEPLTPRSFEPPLPFQSGKVSSNEALLEIIPDLPSLTIQNEDISSDDIDRCFAEIIAPLGIKAERKIEQEKLQAADTERRVPVPVMDFSRPVAPWKGSHDSRTMLAEIKRTHLSKHAWPAVGKTERELRWNPIPTSAGSFEPNETISDDGSTAKFLEQPECIDSETLIWKREGLRIFDHLAEPEEELELGEFPNANDIDALVRRRMLELEADYEENVEAAAKDLPAATVRGTDLGMIQNIAKSKLQVGTIASLQRSPEKPNLLLESLSPIHALENFMFTRNVESQKSKLTVTNVAAEPPKDPDRNIPPENPAVKPSESAMEKPSISVPPFSLPQFTIPSTPHPFVVSTSFLCNRKLARRVQQLHPAAEFIERDFTLHSSAATIRTGLEKQSYGTIADEADIILSPSTGLILTTLPKIKQRSLPGQTARSAAREAIIRAAPRYERLLVLVSGVGVAEGDFSAEETGPDLTEGDCEALVDFMGFCSNTQQDTQAFFVPAGDEQLAHWVVTMMIKHGVTESKLKLLQDETLWELFLRRAGMNAFAAQAILSELRASPSDPQSDFGLTAFVKMEMPERLARFEGLLGGRELLTRVSKTLDARWA